MKHLGILATTPEGAALCFRAFCQEGFRQLGPHDHPDVTLDCTPLARNLAALGRGDYGSVRVTLSASARRLAAAGADFFVCPDNTSTWRSSNPGRTSRCRGCTSQLPSRHRGIEGFVDAHAAARKPVS